MKFRKEGDNFEISIGSASILMEHNYDTLIVTLAVGKRTF
jgi:hypothetical protein